MMLNVGGEGGERKSKPTNCKLMFNTETELMSSIQVKQQTSSSDEVWRSDQSYGLVA